jgi:hypothetical protein
VSGRLQDRVAIVTGAEQDAKGLALTEVYHAVNDKNGAAADRAAAAALAPGGRADPAF